MTITKKQEKAIKAFIKPRVERGEDWQRTMVETIMHFDWLTSSDDDEEFVMNFIRECEDEVAI